MSDTHDERGGDEIPESGSNADLLRILFHHGITDPDDNGLRGRSTHFMPGATVKLLDDLIAWRNAAVAPFIAERNAATARAESATVLPERWRALIAERDAANERANKAGRASRLLLDGQNELDRQRAETDAATHAEFEAAMNELRERAKKAETLCAERVEAARQREETQREASVRDGLRAAKLRLVAASMLRTFVDDVHAGYVAKRSRAVPLADFERWQRVLRETSLAAGADDGSGWTAEEDAEFEKRYGVKAAMQLRAANDRVWQVVQELRQDAVDAGCDPYQDPIARRLSAALVGDGNDSSPRTLPSGPTTEYRYVLADGSESEFELHNEGPCGCRREERPVYVGDWRPAAAAAPGSRNKRVAASGMSSRTLQADVCSVLPESLKGPQTCYTRHVHNGLMHICALAAGHDTHMCAEGDRWTTNNNTTEDDRG